MSVRHACSLIPNTLTVTALASEASDGHVRPRITNGAMPYWLKFTLYLILPFTLTFLIAFLLGPLGRIVNVVFSFAAALLAVIVARRIPS